MRELRLPAMMAGLGCLAAGGAVAQGQQPHVVLIMADDPLPILTAWRNKVCASRR